MVVGAGREGDSTGPRPRSTLGTGTPSSAPSDAGEPPEMLPRGASRGLRGAVWEGLSCSGGLARAAFIGVVGRGWSHLGNKLLLHQFQSIHRLD